VNDRYLSVRVSGDFACFTRPENKVERVSYPILTPSAARGILEAIFWHPQFSWRIREIHVLNPVRTIALMRNEVNSKMSLTGKDDYFADKDRSQRNAVCLRDVDYVIYADADVKTDVGENHAKYRDQFRRRVANGQCYHRPALGCREFAAEFEPVDPQQTPIPVDWTEDLGLMLWDVSYPEGQWDDNGWRPKTKPPYWPKFFNACIENGIMRIPSEAEVDHP